MSNMQEANKEPENLSVGFVNHHVRLMMLELLELISKNEEKIIAATREDFSKNNPELVRELAEAIKGKVDDRTVFLGAMLHGAYMDIGTIALLVTKSLEKPGFTFDKYLESVRKAVAMQKEKVEKYGYDYSS